MLLHFVGQISFKSIMLVSYGDTESFELGVCRGHEIFVMMKPRFLSNLNSCIPFKAWLRGWWITIDHSPARTSWLTIRLGVA